MNRKVCVAREGVVEDTVDGKSMAGLLVGFHAGQNDSEFYEKETIEKAVYIKQD